MIYGVKHLGVKKVTDYNEEAFFFPAMKIYLCLSHEKIQ